MQEKKICCRKNEFSATFFSLLKFGDLLGSFHRKFAEFLEVLHESESGFASACAGGLVTLYYLCLCVLCEFGYFCVDLFDKLFHNWLVFIGFKKISTSNFASNLVKKRFNSKKIKQKS